MAQVCYIFAYGSLMWRPDFEFERVDLARAHGFHRRLGVLSHHYRGTKDKPGLVLGLDRGGSCVGVVYTISAPAWTEVIEKVRKREMLGDVYREAEIKIRRLADGENQTAVAYVIRPQSSQYAARMTETETLRLIHQGNGTSGSCTDYVRNTIRHLRVLAIRDAALERLAPAILQTQTKPHSKSKSGQAA